MCSTLDLALTPINIKSGFVATGIAPFNPNIFSDFEFVQAVQQNSIEVAVDIDLNEDEQRRIVIDDVPNVGREEEVLSSEPSTSRSASAMSGASSISFILDEVGPLQAATPKKKSKRGRKAMQSCELTSPENIAVLKEKASKKAAATVKKSTPKKGIQKKATPPAKRSKTKSSRLSDEDENYCIVCFMSMPDRLTANNSIKCNTCK